MADQEAPKEPQPPRIVSPEGLVYLYDKFHDDQWNQTLASGAGAYRNPTTAMKGIASLGRVAALRIVDVFAELAGWKKRTEAAEKRLAEFETRIAALEKHKDENEARNAAAFKSAVAAMEADGVPADQAAAMVEAMMRGEMPTPPPPATKPEPEVEPVVETPVVPIKKSKKEAAPGNGGAA
jgi:hypothetical protein